eukprot:CAMPEP_0204614098 /NCGR_PEP_ID=MMETSP0717-20131115/1917_1 /ASSEMBLY_ACC=CAM_ASM_000666 /TAXON_ID=230516 /ORGANISM="Chaetoceros curvisetus" /LENGTH=567 /DNA_ID=CAMNT_0051626691 /DNA_START=123 /DNA_END=1826 /DNA_ORIENTATION=+
MNRPAVNMNSGGLLSSNVPNSPIRQHINFHDQYQNHQQHRHGGNGMGMYSSSVVNNGAPGYDQHPAVIAYPQNTAGELNMYNQVNMNAQGIRSHGGGSGASVPGFRGSNAGVNGGARRRSSMMINNFLNEMGYSEGGERGSAPPVTQSSLSQNIQNSPDRRRMEKRNSLDLLGDAAAAVEQQQNHNAAMAAAAASSKRDSLSSLVSGMNNMNSGVTIPIKRMSMDMAMNDHSHIQAHAQAQAHAQVQAQAQAQAAQAQRLNSIDLLVNGGEPTFQSRKNSLSHLLASDFLSPSRRSSLAAGISARAGTDGKTVDPYQLDNIFDENRMSAGLTGLNSTNQNSMLALQLLQQEAQEAEEASALSSVEEYIKLQKLQTALRRQSLSNVVGELSLMQELQNQPSSLSLQKQAELEEKEQQLQYQLQGQLQMEQIQNMMHGSKNNNSMMTSPNMSPQRPPKRLSTLEEDLSEPIIPPSIGSDAIESFQSTMDKSQKSQQDIQSWDKKMGLKRSHSATMTKTTRSRKQLKNFFDMHMQRLQVKAAITKGSTVDQDGMKTILGGIEGQCHRFSM